jgi:hypothetical protein
VKTLKERQSMINRLVVLALSFCVLLLIACGNDEDQCGCTAMVCPDGVSVVVESENGEIFPEGVYLLKWESGDMSGEVGIDEIWTHNDDPTIQIFYIPRQSDSGEYILTEKTETIMLELYLDELSISERVLFNLNWKTTTCNYCDGPCEDLVTNAELEMVVTVP